mgnify:FL=1
MGINLQLLGYSLDLGRRPAKVVSDPALATLLGTLR